MCTVEKVEEMVRSLTVEQMVSKFTKQQLTEMHMLIYKRKPLSASNKESIAHTIKQYFYQIDRALAFKF